MGVRCRILGLPLFGGARRDADEIGTGRDISDDSLVSVLGGIGRIHSGLISFSTTTPFRRVFRFGLNCSGSLLCSL